MLGYADAADSYIHFLALKLTGINFPFQLVDKVTLYLFLVCSTIERNPEYKRLETR